MLMMLAIFSIYRVREESNTPEFEAVAGVNKVDDRPRAPWRPTTRDPCRYSASSPCDTADVASIGHQHAAVGVLFGQPRCIWKLVMSRPRSRTGP